MTGKLHRPICSLETFPLPWRTRLIPPHPTWAKCYYFFEITGGLEICPTGCWKSSMLTKHLKWAAELFCRICPILINENMNCSTETWAIACLLGPVGPVALASWPIRALETSATPLCGASTPMYISWKRISWFRKKLYCLKTIRAGNHLITPELEWFVFFNLLDNEAFEGFNVLKHHIIKYIITQYGTDWSSLLLKDSPKQVVWTCQNPLTGHFKWSISPDCPSPSSWTMFWVFVDSWNVAPLRPIIF